MSKTTIKYSVVIFLIFVFFWVELLVGLFGNSVALQTDAFHMLADLIALVIGLQSHRLSKQNNQSPDYSYGLKRIEIIGGFFNASFLICTCFFLFIEAITKIITLVNNNFINPELEENALLVTIVALIGLFINLIGIFLFCNDHTHHHDEEQPPSNSKNIDTTIIEEIDEKDIREKIINYNQYAVFLHILGDTLGSVVVAISGLLIMFLPWEYKFLLDPIASILIIIFIAFNSIKLLIMCVKILLHQTPIHIDHNEMINLIHNIHGVIDVHDLHIWSLNNHIKLASVHVRINSKSSRTTDAIIVEIKDLMHQQGIHSSTIQPEFTEECLEPNCDENENQCLKKQCC